MSQKLRRFLHLERARPARADGDGAVAAPASTAERFDAVQRPAGRGPRAATRTGADLDRFGPEPEPVVELLDTDGRRPFTRCLRCGMDAHVLAPACPGCNASLDTPEVHAFNERLWAERQARSAEEDAVAAARRAVREAEDVETARLRRAAAEEMAREIGRAERRRLDFTLGRDRWRWSAPLDWLDVVLELLFGMFGRWRR